MGTQEKVCRLCLEICSGFKAIEGDVKDVLFKVLPKIDLASIQEPVMCANCAEILTKCFDFKMAGFYRHDYKVPFVNKDYVKLEPKDGDLGNNEHGTGIVEDQNLCGFCIGPVKTYDVSLGLERGVVLETMIEQFFPEMDLSIIKKSVICAPCHGSLERCFHFVVNCLKVEEKIKKYSESLDVNGTSQIDLKNLLEFTMRDATASEVDSNLVTIKVEKRFCDEELNTDERRIGNEGDICKLEQSFCGGSENTKQEVEHKSFVNMDDWKCDKEEQFTPRSMLTHNKNSNILDAIKIEEPFYGTNEAAVKEENFVKMEDQHCLANEEVEGNIDETDLDRFEGEVPFLPQEIPTKLRKRRKSSNKNHSKKTMYQCECCPFQTKYKQSLKTHSQQHKNPSEIEMYECDICSYRTRYKDGLKAHLLVHKEPSEVAMYKCNICSYQTKRKNALKMHSLSHKDPSELAMYECESCFFQTKDKHYLKKHLLVHKDPSEVTMYKCNNCLYETRHKHSFLRHLVLHKDPAQVTMYKCDSCDFQTKNKYYLKNHILVHKDPSEVTMYKCDLCPFETKRNRRLKDHLQVHMDLSEVMLFKCESCPFQTRRRDGLRSHMLTHKDPSEVTMYKCDSCEFQTKDKYYLKKHLLVHKDSSEVEMYKCDTCVYETKRKHAFKRHQILHKNPSEITMYKCLSCSFQSRYKHGLKRHLPMHKD